MRFFLAPTKHDSDPSTGAAINGGPADALGRDAQIPGGRYEYAPDESQCLVWVDRSMDWTPPVGWRELQQGEATDLYTAWRRTSPCWS